MRPPMVVALPHLRARALTFSMKARMPAHSCARDEAPLAPSISPAGHARALQATFADMRTALDAVGAEMLLPPHWWGQVRYRRCLIYWALLYVGGALLVAEAARAIVEAGRRGSERRAAKDRNF